jgi:hypothetical protein
MTSTTTANNSDLEKQLHLPTVIFTGLGLSLSCLILYNLLNSLYSQLFSLLCIAIISFVISKKLLETDFLYTPIQEQ